MGRCGHESGRILDVDQRQCQGSCDCRWTGEKEKTSGADIQLQSMGYTKQQDADASDSSVRASDAPENPHLLRVI